MGINALHPRLRTPRSVMIGLFGWPIKRVSFYNELESSLPSGAAPLSLHSLIRNRKYRKWFGVAIQGRVETPTIAPERPTADAEWREKVRPQTDTDTHLASKDTKIATGERRRDGETATLQPRWMMIEGSWSAMEQPCAKREWDGKGRAGMDWVHVKCSELLLLGWVRCFAVWSKRGGMRLGQERRQPSKEDCLSSTWKRSILLPKNG